MIFPKLSVFQNIAFIIACISLVLMIVYIICANTGLARKTNNMQSDDIDNADENYSQTLAFIFNAFTIKGSIFFVAMTFSLGFLLSLFIATWLAFIISAVAGLGVVVLLAFADRGDKVENGQVAVVCEDIPENTQGCGKIIVSNDGVQLDAITYGKTLKKGRRVIIIKQDGNTVVVKKYNRLTK